MYKHLCIFKYALSNSRGKYLHNDAGVEVLHVTLSVAHMTTTVLHSSTVLYNKTFSQLVIPLANSYSKGEKPLFPFLK